MRVHDILLAIGRPALQGHRFNHSRHSRHSVTVKTAALIVNYLHTSGIRVVTSALRTNRLDRGAAKLRNDDDQRKTPMNEILAAADSAAL